ncbi:MAG TPA: TFIIB-type zinc ribbon-containing protein [Nitrososphaeraceae archaeon]|jgi:transcription initiation factor TFIIB|nr:TFIIB-type zinc ribbon-containing protein [Nitrososphaeraceae archaeon]
MKTTEYYTRCPECGSGLINDYAKGEYICQKCGYVVLDQADDYGPESHSADYEEKTRNTRASGFTSFSLHNYGLRTEIGFGSRDYSGKSIDYHIAEHMNNMRKWHSRIRVASPKERRLSNVLSKINETCSAMSLPKTVVETAAVLYRNFDSRNEARGKSIACMAAATIYLACKRCSIVRSLEEIVKAASITDKERSSLKLAAKYYRFMVMETDIFIEQPVTSLSSSPSSGVTTAPSILSYPLTQTRPIPVTLAIDQYISKLANVAKIDTKVERLAIDIAHKTDDHLLADGKAPNGLAAAYIYLAAVLLGVNLLQIDVSNLAGVTEVTIRNRCKDILTSFKLTLRVKQSL